MPQLISKKILYDLREHLSSRSTLGQIDVYFGSANIPFDENHVPSVNGERRRRVEKYYKSLDLAKIDDVRLILRLFELILTDLEAQATSPGNVDAADSRTSLEHFCKTLRDDDFAYENGRIFAVGHSSIPELASLAAAADVPHLLKQLERIKGAVDADPWLVIGTAKELVETTCKTILSERGKVVDPAWKLMELCKEARKELRLTADGISDSAKAAETIKVLLNNLATIVQGLSELRNPYGTGHGHDGRARGLKPRHARLAAGAASTLALFMLETHHETKPKADGERT
jgi:Abortive infection C-terminus